MFKCVCAVVGSPGDFGSFRQPKRTESENLDYVLRGKKACVRCANCWRERKRVHKRKPVKSVGGRRKRGCQRTGNGSDARLRNGLRKPSAVVWGVWWGVGGRRCRVWYPAAAPYFFYYRQSGGA